MKTSTVLIVEDDEDILDANAIFLQYRGYHIIKAATLEEAKKNIRENSPNIIILDILMPDGSGIDFCKEIRDISPAPILFLSCLGERPEIVHGLVSGGDDYMTKPYNMDELAARCASLLRRVDLDKNKQPTTIANGPLTLDICKQTAFLSGEDILLTPKEFNLLLLLVQNQGKHFTAKEIYTKVWGHQMNDGIRTVQVHISNLRKKLKVDIQSIVEIEMIKRKFYQLNIENKTDIF